MEFFIINDAIFSKLCILGDDVEPCFEGASVQAPQTSSTFTKIDDTFKNTLYSMLKDLQKYTLSEGGQEMTIEDNIQEKEVVVENNETVVEDTTATVVEAENETQSTLSEEETTEFAKNDKEEEENDKNDEEDSDENYKCKGDKKKYSLLEEEYNSLSVKYSELESKYNELVEFKKEIENKEKDKLIEEFYMLSDEDKAEVINNKANYSLEEIEAKLSVICVRKRVNFNVSEEKKTEPVVTTFNLDNVEETVPGYISALRNTKNRNKNK